ncbi:MAG TPA: serine/threonine-protein kinase, partial [Rubrobacter sp.]|nr:serine/threonine-protein kinase [Rubrobacter sp.]
RDADGDEGRVATLRQRHGPGGHLVSGMEPASSVRRLGDRFVLVRELGSGGMARVFLGRDEVLDRPVAVKVVEPDPEDPEIGLRFQREGRAAARLSHPNIVRVFDAGEDELNGREVSYIVMEYVPGGDLQDLMDRNGPLPETMLSRVGADVASGLAHAHERGIIHRDVKPRNILLDDRGSPRLADFGIARALDGTTSRDRSGSYLGTAAYSSPEQLRGEKVTPKSDVYSFGATLYHAAVGKRPFSGNSIEVANQHILKMPAPPCERGARIGEGLEALILSCLAKDPGKRPDAARLRDKLQERSVADATAALAGSNARAGGFRGAAGISRVAEAARTAGSSSAGAVRRKLDDRRAAGPPESTISLPTRTFRAGSRQRTMLAVMMVAILILLLTVAGAWALLGQGEQGKQSSGQGAGQQEQAKASRQEPKEKPDQKPDQAAAPNPSGESGSSGGTPEENPAPAPPLASAEKAVFNLYYQESFARVDASWAYLSQRFQNEIGSPEQWAEQEDIYTFTYMRFTSYPVARAVGDTAEVTFEVRLDHTWGSELLSGTWVCVNEGGEWKLDRLKNEKTVPA